MAARSRSHSAACSVIRVWTVHTRLAEQAAECDRLRAAIDDAVESLDDGATDEARARLKAARDG